jgi:hypothetical protein
VTFLRGRRSNGLRCSWIAPHRLATTGAEATTVVVGAAVEKARPLAAVEAIGTLVAEEAVDPGATEELVRPWPDEGVVVAGAAVQEVVHPAPDDLVGAIIAEEAVAAGASVDQIVAGYAEGSIRPLVAEWRSPRPLAVGSRVAFVARFLGSRLTYTYEVEELSGERFTMRTFEGPFRWRRPTPGRS